MRPLTVLQGFARSAMLLLLFVMLQAGCGAGDEQVLEFENPDLALFQQTAYPILLRDCGFPACHGDPARFFRVFGPGRTRLVPTMASDEPFTAEEVQASYTRAVSMLVSDGDLLDSWLLRKPLDDSLGGSFHEGVDAWGRNVYYSTSDPAYDALVRWAYSGLPPTGAAP